MVPVASLAKGSEMTIISVAMPNCNDPSVVSNKVGGFWLNDMNRVGTLRWRVLKDVQTKINVCIVWLFASQSNMFNPCATRVVKCHSGINDGTQICSENRWNPVGCSRMGPCGNDWPTSPQLVPFVSVICFIQRLPWLPGKNKPPSVNRQLSSALIHVLKPPIGSLRWSSEIQKVHAKSPKSSCHSLWEILWVYLGWVVL